MGSRNEGGGNGARRAGGEGERRGLQGSQGVESFMGEEDRHVYDTVLLLLVRFAPPLLFRPLHFDIISCRRASVWP